jgi:hypothetical protein
LVEHASLPEHSRGQLMGQPPVGLPQFCDTSVERCLEGSTSPDLIQDTESGAARLNAGG